MCLDTGIVEEQLWGLGPAAIDQAHPPVPKELGDYQHMIPPCIEILLATGLGVAYSVHLGRARSA